MTERLYHRIALRQRPVSKGGATVRLKGEPPSEGLKFPIPDAAHARNAMARMNQAKPPLTAEQKRQIALRARRFLGLTPAIARVLGKKVKPRAGIRAFGPE